jgi:hypothetical protein
MDAVHTNTQETKMTFTANLDKKTKIATDVTALRPGKDLICEYFECAYDGTTFFYMTVAPIKGVKAIPAFKAEQHFDSISLEKLRATADRLKLDLTAALN